VCSGGQVTCAQTAQPGVESCNGLDDDCDGAIDNGNPGGGQSCNTGLLGACSGGTTACAAGQITCTQTVQPVAEVCDGLIDNNCNGQNDEGCNCVNGSTQSCYAGAAGTAGVGACHTGTQTCVNGNFGACVGQVIPTAETCDGVDNNCNGQTDDGLGTISCGAGQCGNTVAACVNGSAATCTPKAASAEICDGLDNDCDGIVDNGSPGSGAACSTGKQGVCSAGLTACTVGAIVCNQTTAPSTETCDGLDNDCNGVVDNGNPSGGAACSTGQQGICAAGTTACSAGAVVCNRNQNPTTETCDGLDNDCNGVVDNGNPSGGAACTTGQLGVCSAGVTACTGGAVICNRTTNPSSETCDGKDNDCNGVVDNGNPGGGAGCSTGLQGICSAGTTACTAGAITCTQTQAAKIETCNGVDDDCNGVIDNGNPGSGAACSTGQLGVCAAGTTTCSGGSLACTRTTAPATETCNGLDDDCSGVVDNGNPGAGIACTTGQSGICSPGTTACVSGAVACNRTSNPVVETCNGLDDDCNGVVDDGCNVPAGPTTLVFLPMDGPGSVTNDNSSADFVNFAGAGVSFLPSLAPSISALAPKYGTGSGSFKNGYLKTAPSSTNVIGNADFTMEFWVKYTGALDTFGSIVLSGSGWDITLGNTNYNNTADFSFNNQSARWWGGTVGWGVLPVGVWSHLSISRSGTSLYTHLNGVWKATATIAAGARLEGVASTSVLTVGSFAPAYIDDLLITVGGVKHTVANFTPAQQPGVPYIYLPMDGPGDGENLSADFRNSVPGGPVVSLVGAPGISSTLAGCAGCGNFMAGSLTTPVAAASAIGTRDFTMEFWVKNASLETFGSPVVSSGNGAASYWDISLGNANYNGNADFAYYTTENSGSRHWGGDISWGALPLNTWTHLSLTRLGTSLITHKNGTLVSTLTIPATTRMEGPTATSAAITIGSHPSYLDDVMITLGTARHTTANFSVVRSTNFPRLVASPEPHVFLPLDGAAASTSFPNLAASSAAFTATGTPSITTSTVKFGGASGNFQTGSIASASSADNVIGARDFTMEFWVNYSAQGTFGTPVIAGNGWDISLGNTNYNGNADFAFGNQSARWWGGTVGWGAVAKNTWVHLALSRSGDRLYTHKNGTLISVVAISPSSNMEAGALASAITVGASPSYLDDVVLTLGAAKYSTADFTVPVVQPKSFMYFPMDGANLATTFTNFGTGPVVNKVSSPFLTNTTAVHGGVSANLTGGSLATAASSAYKLGTSDFTIEFWVKNSFLETFGSTVASGSGWDISLGNANYNGNADFAFYPTETSGSRHWGGDIGWGALPLNTWVHLSLTRSGLRLYTHKNGVLVATRAVLATDSMEGPNASSTVAIGTHPSYIDDLTVTIGTARHTSANFTVYP
jgi:hypothetical protein